MKKIKTELEDCYILEPNRFGDNRGYFSPVYINQELKELGFGKIATICGRYYMMDRDNNYDRVVYNAFINSKVLPVNNKNRVFTTMDMFPTTLAALGVSIEGDRLGLGTNLFSSKKTIPEEIGLDNFNKELKKSSDYYYKYIRK